MPSSSFTGGAIIGLRAGIRHTKILGIDNDVDATKVRPTDWHADHINVSVTATAEQITAVSLAVSGALVTLTSTLAAGTYMALGKCRVQSFTNSASPGSVQLRKGGVAFGPSEDLRTLVNIPHNVMASFSHTGGSVTIDLYFTREAGTTVFGITSDSRFSQTLLVWRIGD